MVGAAPANAERADPDHLQLSLWVAIALGFFADLYLPLGRAGWFVQSSIGLLWPLLAACGLIAVVVGCAPVDRWDAASSALIGLLVAWLLAIVVLDLVPPIARDELTHHLAIPALYVRAGRVLEVPFADQAYYPMLLEMFYTPLVAHGWESVAKLLHLGFGIATAALVFAYLQGRTSTPVALLSALLLISTPTVTVLAASAYVDLGLLFYTAVALIALLRWSETRRASYFVIAGLGAGCGASVKYNGVLLIVLLALVVLLLARERGALVAVGLSCAFGAISLLPMLPWLAKNAMETGNPIFPLFNAALGGRPLPANPSIDVFTKRQLLYGESWLEIVLTPIRVFVTGREGDPARFDGAFNPLYLVGFVALVRHDALKRDRWLAGVAAMLLLMVFLLNTFRSRYAISVLVPLALVLAELLQVSGRQWRRATAAAVVAALLFNGWHLANLWTTVDPLSYLRGRESRETYIGRFVPEYPLIEFANRALPADALVDLEFLGSRGFYWQRAYRYDTYFSGTTLRDTIRSAANGDDVAARLRQIGITHIASADRLLLRYLRDNLTETEYTCWEDFARGHLRLIYGDRGFGLYAIG